MGPDLANRVEAFVEAGGVWDAALLAALLDDLEVDPTGRVLADALRPILLRPTPNRRAANDVEGVVYPRLWKIIEAIRDDLPDGEVRNRIEALRLRLAEALGAEPPRRGGGGGDGDRTWTLSAAAWLAVAEVVLLAAVVLGRGSSAAALTIAFLAIKLPFCLQLWRRRPGAYLGVFLWELAGVAAAVRASGAAIGLRITELVVAVAVMVLLGASISLFPTVRLAESGGPVNRLVTRRRAAVSVLIALALSGFYLAYLIRGDNEQPVLKDEAVRLVRPPPGDRVLRQSEIYVELAADYVGVLVVNGVEIPEDQLDRTVGLNAVAFTPGEGKEIEELPAGTTCASAVFWPINQTRAEGRSYRWCFEAH